MTMPNRRNALLAILLATFLVSPSLAQENTPSRPTIPKLPDARPEIVELVAYDQWDRGVDMFTGKEVKTGNSENWDEINKRDAQRETKARALLTEGKVETGREYEFLALVFQHSSNSEGLRLAHVLAVTAVAKGRSSARWLSAATLDRFLQSLHQPQIFGTQLLSESRDNGPTKWTMEPYDRKALTDIVRAAWCIIPLAEQEKILKDVQSGKPPRSSMLDSCK